MAWAIFGGSVIIPQLVQHVNFFGETYFVIFFIRLKTSFGVSIFLEAYDLGIKYIGVCCGANPMLIRETAEAVGLKVPASKYRENMENHFMYGKNKRIPKHMTEYGDKA